MRCDPKRCPVGGRQGRACVCWHNVHHQRPWWTDAEAVNNVVCVLILVALALAFATVLALSIR
jgi:hypothetical protein